MQGVEGLSASAVGQEAVPASRLRDFRHKSSPMSTSPPHRTRSWRSATGACATPPCLVRKRDRAIPIISCFLAVLSLKRWFHERENSAV
jgi:hypothetical protein